MDINAEALRLDGRKREQLVGRTHWDAYPGSETSELGQLYKSAMSQPHNVALEHRYQWPDGHSLWLEVRAYPVEGAGLALFFRDASERHANEERLSESEARFRSAIDAAQGILWTNDADGRMTGEQPGWAKLTGQSFEAYQGYGWSDAIHPDEAQTTIDAWNAAVAARIPFEFEHRVKRHDGEWRLFAIRAIPILDDCGRVREWVGVHTDITHASETRLQLERNARTFASLVHDNPFGVYVIDAGFKLLHISRGAEKVFGNIEHAIGRDLAEVLRLLWNEPFASEAINRFRATLATGEPHISLSTIEQRADVKNVEAYDWRIGRIALPDGSDGVVCYFYDLSERMKLEDELRQALAHKDMLAREIEHRVQNSLSIVAGLLMMQRSSADSLETKEALAAASLRVIAIGRVHRQLYKGGDIGVVEFGQYLRQLCKDVEETLGRTNLSFEIQTDTVEVSVNTAVSLGIVANELLTNACKYSDPATGYRVSVELVTRADELRLTVTDNGPGMPDGFSPRSNSGLGLKVITALVEQINGTIVFPEAGQEARFQIIVPTRVQ